MCQNKLNSMKNKKISQNFEKLVLGNFESTLGRYLQRQSFRSWWALSNGILRFKIGSIIKKLFYFFRKKTVKCKTGSWPLGVAPTETISQTFVRHECTFHIIPNLWKSDHSMVVKLLLKNWADRRQTTNAHLDII